MATRPPCTPWEPRRPRRWPPTGEAVAQALGCQAREVIFTSGGTEGDNWAISLAAHLGRHRGKHIITTAVEHAAVLEPLQGPGGPGVPGHLPHPRPRRAGEGVRPGGRPPAGHGAGVHDAGEQRDRGHPAGEGGRAGAETLPFPGPPPHRRHPGFLEDPLHPRGAGGGSAHRERPQDRGP